MLLVPELLGCVVDTVWAVVLAGADGDERDVAVADGVAAVDPGVALDVSRPALGATSAVVPDVAPGESVVEAIGAPVKLAP